MENMRDVELVKSLMNELIQGKELAKQLQIHLNMPSSSSLRETNEVLVQKILNSYEKALSMLYLNNDGSPVGDPQSAGVLTGCNEMSESLQSLSGSPVSDDSDRDFKDQEHKDGSKKRKSVPRWTKKVQVCPGIGLEGPLDDGCQWRKYGQKDILGAKFPRGYYRCTHRNAHGCLATKQVQRSDEDPTMFEITYRGRHTCGQATHHQNPSSSTSPPIQEPIDQTKNQHQFQHQPQEVLLNFKTGLKVITDDLSPISFNSTSNINNCENHHFLSADSLFESSVMMTGYDSPSFISPATSGSNYFSVSPSNNFGGNPNLHGSEPDLTDIISAATSATNSPTVGFEFPFGQPELDPSFTFDNPRFFS